MFTSQQKEGIISITVLTIPIEFLDIFEVEPRLPRISIHLLI